MLLLDPAKKGGLGIEEKEKVSSLSRRDVSTYTNNKENKKGVQQSQ